MELWACYDGLEFVYLTHSDRSDPGHGIRCARVRDIEEVAKLAYYAARLIALLA